MANPNQQGNNPRNPRSPILGQGHGLSDEEGEMIAQMIREAQHSARELQIPAEDLAKEASTQMSPETTKVIEASQVQKILHMFNRDFVYGQGRFDEYSGGLIFKWGDGYSRKHIWVSVENGNLLFETNHSRQCNKSYCTGTHHVLTPDLYTNWDLVNQELGDLFRRPVQETTED